jgi:hypothetical protein
MVNATGIQERSQLGKAHNQLFVLRRLASKRKPLILTTEFTVKNFRPPNM